MEKPTYVETEILNSILVLEKKVDKILAIYSKNNISSTYISLVEISKLANVTYEAVRKKINNHIPEALVKSNGRLSIPRNLIYKLNFNIKSIENE